MLDIFSVTHFPKVSQNTLSAQLNQTEWPLNLLEQDLLNLRHLQDCQFHILHGWPAASRQQDVDNHHHLLSVRALHNCDWNSCVRVGHPSVNVTPEPKESWFRYNPDTPIPFVLPDELLHNLHLAISSCNMQGVNVFIIQL